MPTGPGVVLLLVVLLAVSARAEGPVRRLQELRRFPAPEARQAVAVDAGHFYAIDNRSIGKYAKHSGERVAGWTGAADGGIHHLNSGHVVEGRLYCAHSNYPEVPMLSSIEIFDAESLEHVGSHSFGIGPGSATWIDRRQGLWWVVFAHYGGLGGIPGRGPAWTSAAIYDAGWRRVGGYGFPSDLVARFQGHSNSGGAFGPDGLLYATGHDAPELYALRVPDSGASLEWVETLPLPAEGQGIAWDPAEPGVLYSIVRSSREVVASRLVER